VVVVVPFFDAADVVSDSAVERAHGGSLMWCPDLSRGT
jgi:hypothetical protein